MRSQVPWRIAALTVLVFAAVVSVATSRGQVAWNSKGTANPTASKILSATATAATTQFSKAFTGPWANAGQIRYSTMAVDSQDNMIVAGTFAGRINFGGGDILSHGGVDIFIAKYSPDGSYLWSQAIGGSSDDWAKAVAVDLQPEAVARAVDELRAESRALDHRAARLVHLPAAQLASASRRFLHQRDGGVARVAHRG